MLVDCDACSKPLRDEDTDAQVHFPDEATARSMADGYDYQIAPNGGAWCPDCQLLPHVHVGANEWACDRCGIPDGDHTLEQAVTR